MSCNCYGRPCNNSLLYLEGVIVVARIACPPYWLVLEMLQSFYEP